MSTLVLWLALVPAIAVLISAYERRKLWRHPNYALVNQSLASLGAGLVLMSPAADPLGDAIFAGTGRWHGEDVIGHTLVIIGLLCLTAHAMRACTWLTGRTVVAATHLVTLFVVALWVMWATSEMADEPIPGAPQPGGEVVYWAFLAVGLGVMSAIAVGIFAYISRKAIKPCTIHVARLYMVGAGFLLLACGNRVFEIVTDSYTTADLVLDYALRTCGTIAVAIAAHVTLNAYNKPVAVASVSHIDA